MKLHRGYSLIEVVIGLAIITIFLVCTGSLINASYTNYRLILQRNEAIEFAIREMEDILQSEEVSVSTVGYTENSMHAKVSVEKVKDGNKIYDDKIFLVTVDVEYSKTPTSDEKYNIKLQSLKVVKE